jgi:FkbM family methyltransferase
MHKGLGYWARKIPSAAVNRSRQLFSFGYGRLVSLPVHRHGFRAQSPAVRRAVLDAAPDDAVLIAHTGQEMFAVLKHDRPIGRSMFVSRVPFEFDILHRAHALVSRTHRVTHIVDIGANIGPICIAGITRGLFATATAIEPAPANFRLLSANVYLNGLGDRIDRHAVALGARDGEVLSFALSEDNFGDHRVLQQSSATDRTLIEVPSRRLDTLLPELDAQKTLLWMDVQGYEGPALAGATAILASRPPLVFEFWASEIARNGTYDLLRTALVDAGYRRFYVIGEDMQERPFSGEAFDALYERLKSDPDHVDVLML